MEQPGDDEPVGEALLGGLTHGIAGAGAGVVAAIATCPLDVVKTKLQVQKVIPGLPVKYQGIFGSFKVIVTEEGFRGCYRGLGTTTMALVSNWCVYFAAYHKFKAVAKHAGYAEGTVMHGMAAVSAAIVTDVSVSPLWMIKTRLQAQQITDSKPKYKSTFHALHKIMRQEGPKALWQGLTPQLLGIGHVGIQFPLYEKIKHWFSIQPERKSPQLTITELSIASSVSKLFASVTFYPHEVLRSRLQFQVQAGSHPDPNRYKGVIDAVQRIAREEGFLGFYRGMGANLLRVVPTCAITFVSYELMLRFLTDNF